MMLVLLGGLLYFKGSLHWDYYRAKGNLDTESFLDYVNSIESLGRTMEIVLLIYGPFFSKHILDDPAEMRGKVSRIYVLLTIWWLGLAYAIFSSGVL